MCFVSSCPYCGGLQENSTKASSWSKIAGYIICIPSEPTHIAFIKRKYKSLIHISRAFALTPASVQGTPTEKSPHKTMQGSSCMKDTV